MAGPRIVLATIGSLGDLHPFLAVGQALAARGAAPVLAVPHDHVAKCRAAGLEAVAILPPFDRIGRELGLSDEDVAHRVLTDLDFLVDRILLPPLADSTDRLIAAARGADLVFGSIFALAAPIAAQALSLPFAAAVLQPMSWFSPLDPPAAPGFEGFVKSPAGPLGIAWNRLAAVAMAAIVKRRYARRIDSVRTAHGLPPSDTVPILRPGTRPDLSLGLYSSVLGSLPADAPTPSALTGFPWFDSGDGRPSLLDPGLAAFLAAGEAPIVVTLGSFVPHAAQDFYRRAACIAADLGKRMVLLTPTDPGVDLPNVKTVGYAPHSLLFPHAALVIHHGGVGTTGQALRAGKPQLIVPFMGDQFDHARRITKLGVGLTASPRSFARHGAALMGALTDGACLARAKAIAEQVRAEDGAGVAAEQLIRLAASRRRPDFSASAEPQ